MLFPACKDDKNILVRNLYRKTVAKAMAGPQNDKTDNHVCLAAIERNFGLVFPTARSHLAEPLILSSGPSCSQCLGKNRLRIWRCGVIFVQNRHKKL